MVVFMFCISALFKDNWRASCRLPECWYSSWR